MRFLQYAIEGLRDGLREQISTVRAEQRDVAWRNYVHEKFAGKSSPAHIRQRHLVLDLSLREGGVSKSELTALSGRLAAAYAGKGEKTMTRDLNALRKMEFIRRIPRLEKQEGDASKVSLDWVANKALIDAFLPRRRNNESGRLPSVKKLPAKSEIREPATTQA